MLPKNNFKLLLLMTLFFVILNGSDCNAKNGKELILPIDSTKLIQLKNYYTSINNDVTEFNLADEYNDQSKPFNHQEIKNIVKRYNFGTKYVGSSDRYYELGWFEYKNNTYKMIMYKKLGEADTSLLNVQLNSYDTKGNLVDALLLNSFYGYEGMNCFSNFIINPDYTIDIDSYVIYRYEEDKDGLSDRPIAKPSTQAYLKEKHKIVNGRFELISSMKKQNNIER